MQVVQFGHGLRKMSSSFHTQRLKEIFKWMKVNRGIEAPRPGHVRRNKEANLAGECSVCGEGTTKTSARVGGVDVRPQSRSF